MGDTERLYRVVVTGDNLAPEAMKILPEKCRVEFSGPYPQPADLAHRLSQAQKEPPHDLNLFCNAGKVVLTPHVAAATEEAFARMGIEAAQNVMTILEGRRPDIESLANPEIYGQG